MLVNFKRLLKYILPQAGDIYCHPSDPSKKFQCVLFIFCSGTSFQEKNNMIKLDFHDYILSMIVYCVSLLSSLKCSKPTTSWYQVILAFMYDELCCHIALVVSYPQNELLPGSHTFRKESVI